MNVTHFRALFVIVMRFMFGGHVVFEKAKAQYQPVQPIFHVHVTHACSQQHSEHRHDCKDVRPGTGMDSQA
jgi:hypothetical protein